MPLKTHMDEQPTLNLTPMIDIVFLLIIFFMVGTKFAEMEHHLRLEVPRVATTGAMTPAPEKRVINVFNDGSIIMDHEPLSIEDMKRVLSAAVQEYPELGVLVRGDADGPFQNVATVLTAVRSAGIQDMGISVKLDPVRR